MNDAGTEERAKDGECHSSLSLSSSSRFRVAHHVERELAIKNESGRYFRRRFGIPGNLGSLGILEESRARAADFADCR